MEHKSRSPSPPPPKVAPPTLLSQQQQQGQDSWAKGIFSTPPPEPPKKPTASATPPPPPSSPTSQQPPSPLPPATPPSAVDSPTTKSTSPSPSAAAHVCGYCGKPATKKCTRCKNTHYCSRECQTKDWQFGHKGVCTQTPPKGLPENALASSNFLPQRFDLSEKPLEGPPALRGAPQDLGPLQKAIKSFISTPPVPYGFTNDVNSITIHPSPLD